MQDIHARHRLPRGERRHRGSRALALLVLLALGVVVAAPPAGAVGPELCSDPLTSTGDPDDGDHRELPAVKAGVVVTATQPCAAAAGSAGIAPTSPARAAGSTGPAAALRPARLARTAFLRALVRIWILHR